METFGFIKPETSLEQLVDILARINAIGLQVTEANFTLVSDWLADEHYRAHREKHFYPTLIKQLAGQVVYAMRLSGSNAVVAWRNLVGDYDEAKRQPGTIRGDFMQPSQPYHLNYCHSAEKKDVARELRLWQPRLKDGDTVVGDYEVTCRVNGVVHARLIK